MTFQEKIEKYLSSLPHEWRTQLTEILCEINNQANIDCEKVKECETLTTLSDFSIQGTSVFITYKDEENVSYSRSFDVAQILNVQLDDLNPGCLTDATTWSNLSFSERIQLLIDKHCDCCA